MREALRWFVRSFGPYAVGILVGVFFAYLLTLFVAGTKVPTSYEQWLALVKEASQAAHTIQPVATPAAAPEAVAKHGTKPILPPAASVAPVTPPAATPAVKPPAVTPAVTPPAVTPAVTPPAVTPAVTPPAVTPAVTPPAATPAATPPAPLVANKEPVQPKVVAKAPEKPVAPPEKKENAVKDAPSPDHVLSCGAPPRQPSPEMNRYLACRWKENCLNRLAQARYMIEQGKLRCPTVGYDAQACQSYYQSMEDHYQPSMCEY